MFDSLRREDWDEGKHGHLTTKLTGDTASVDLGWSRDIHEARWSKWQRAVASECSDWLGSAAWLIAFPLICRAKF